MIESLHSAHLQFYNDKAPKGLAGDPFSPFKQKKSLSNKKAKLNN